MNQKVHNWISKIRNDVTKSLLLSLSPVRDKTVANITKKD